MTFTSPTQSRPDDGARAIRSDLLDELPESIGLPADRSGRVTDVLPFAGLTVAAHPNNKPDGIDSRNGTAEAQEDQWDRVHQDGSWRLGRPAPHLKLLCKKKHI
jgi:hypothetical protein